MWSFLSRLCSEVCRLWLLCCAFLFASKSIGSAGLPVWSNEVDEFSSRLPLLTKRSSSSPVLDDVNGKRKGPSIAGSQAFGELRSVSDQFSTQLTVPPMHGIYNWADHFELPQLGKGFVFFKADCSNDVHVAISPQPQSVNPMYELVIGGWGNTASVLRRRSQGPKLSTVPEGLNKPRLDTVNDLWISIDTSTKLLRMGRGREPSLESVFLVYKDPHFLSDAREEGAQINAPSTSLCPKFHSSQVWQT